MIQILFYFFIACVSKGMWAVVVFDVDDSVSMAPSFWIYENVSGRSNIIWPPANESAKCISARSKPKDHWKRFLIKILATTG